VIAEIGELGGGIGLYEYSLLPSMKLPRFLVSLLRLPPKKRLRPVGLYVVLSFRADPPKQKNIVAKRKQKKAAHSKPKAYLPI
jgi:hypothetical protein